MAKHDPSETTALPPTIREKLRALRGAKSLRAFASEVGVSHSTVDQVERGLYGASWETLEKWAHATGHRLAIVPVVPGVRGELAAIAANLSDDQVEVLLQLARALPGLKGDETSVIARQLRGLTTPRDGMP